MEFSSILLLFGVLILGILVMRWKKSLNPRQQFWATIIAGGLLLCLLIGNGVYHWTAIPMAGAGAYAIYRQYKAYAAYRTAEHC